MICANCGYNSLSIVRDYTGAPYVTCLRCYRSNPFYRISPLNPSIETNAAPPLTGITTPGDTGPGLLLEPSPPEQIRVRPGHEVEPGEVNRHLSKRFL